MDQPEAAESKQIQRLQTQLELLTEERDALRAQLARFREGQWRRLCQCVESDPVMQADDCYYCHRCSFLVPAGRWLIEDLKAQLAELVRWKAREQAALLAQASTLLTAGFRGDGVVEGVEWLASEQARAKRERDEVVADLEAAEKKRRELEAQLARPPEEPDFSRHSKRCQWQVGKRTWYCAPECSAWNALTVDAPATQLARPSPAQCPHCTCSCVACAACGEEECRP